MSARGLGGLLAAALLASSAPAFAEPTPVEKETARKLVKSGRAKLKAGEVDAALEDLQAAHDIMGVPTTGLALGKGQIEAGKLVEARDTLLAVTRIPEAPRDPWQFKKARADAKKLAKEIEPRIPQLEIELENRPEGAEVEVEIDGDEVSSAAMAAPLSLNPGAHTITVRVGSEKKSVEVILSEGDVESTSIDLTGMEPPPAPEAPEPSEEESGSGFPTFGYVGFGIAGTGLILGTATGAAALKKGSSARDDCIQRQCPPSTHGTIDKGRRLGTVSTVSFILAGAGVGLGTWALLARDDGEKPPNDRASATVWLGVASAGVRGQF